MKEVQVLLVLEFASGREFVGPFGTVDDALAHGRKHLPETVSWHCHPVYRTVSLLRKAVADEVSECIHKNDCEHGFHDPCECLKEED